MTAHVIKNFNPIRFQHFDGNEKTITQKTYIVDPSNVGGMTDDINNATIYTDLEFAQISMWQATQIAKWYINSGRMPNIPQNSLPDFKLVEVSVVEVAC